MHFCQKLLLLAKSLAFSLGLSALLMAHVSVLGMDTDIFTINSGNAGPAPNVLIVLDNTSNWSRQSQQWLPTGTAQGQAEVNAIKTVINSLNANTSVNMGLMEFVTGGPATDDGGYVRFALSPIGSTQTGGTTNRTALSNILTNIYNNINGPTEKTNSEQAYGNLLYDVYNYLAGITPYASSSDVVSSLADSNGYRTNYTRFKSPLTAETGCARTYIIFIGNPNASGPVSDSTANTTALSNLGGNTSPLSLPQFTTSSTTTTDNLGLTSACYSNLSQCSTSDFTAQCANYGSCACSASTTSATGCTGQLLKYMVQGSATTLRVTPTGTTVLDTSRWNADEWSRFFYQKGIPVADGARQTVTTYTIDVFKAQQNADQTSLLLSMAKAGGGRYFSATNEQAITIALQTIFSEILAANSAFASASLPISATNREQNQNQVYIGMFRPDQNSLPRWFGNLKRYQIANFASGADLADFNGSQAVNTTTGFITSCAVSWWTSDSGNYWASVAGSTVSPRVFFTAATNPGLAWESQGDDTLLAQGTCGLVGANPYSDTPDGPVIEKGGVAEVLRNATSRTVKTLSGTALVNFTTSTVTASADATINSNIVNFIQGQDVTGEINGVRSTSKRPSIHGDVIHSRPLPVDYGGSTGVVIYYGANDGTYRAVSAATGSELWAFVAPEFFPTLQRLLDNSPTVSASTPKSFFFDGSTGLYVGAKNNSPADVWIFPAMRRGGRMVYALNVTDPNNPQFLWKAGCPNINDNTGCTSSEFTSIGQTWSTPVVAFLPGHSTITPVVVMGGGYAACEDPDVTPATSGFCSSTTGNAVYVLDAQTGSVVKAFSTYLDNNGTSYPLPRSIAADISLVDINSDGKADAAYVADTGGNIYRIDFSDTSFNPLAPTRWTMKRVAYTNGAGRKFLFAPTVLPYRNKVYLAIGSGDRERPLITNYPYQTPIINRFYLYLDDPARTTSTNLDGTNMLNSTNASYATCTSTTVLPGSTYYGWFMDLTADSRGEQTVTSALIVSGMIAFSTNRPVSSSNSCSTALGEARGYWVNLLNGSGAVGVAGFCGGSRYSLFAGGGLPPSPVMGTVSVDGKLTTVVIGASQRSGSASSPVSAQQTRPPISPRRTRTYWQSSGDTR